jgi:hypothetical protein
MDSDAFPDALRHAVARYRPGFITEAAQETLYTRVDGFLRGCFGG